MPELTIDRKVDKVTFIKKVECKKCGNMVEVEKWTGEDKGE